MTTWRGEWAGAWVGEWEGDTGGGGATFGDMSAILAGGGQLSGGIRAIGGLSSQAAGRGELQGRLEQPATVQPPVYGGGYWRPSAWAAMPQTHYVGNLSAVLQGRGRMIARPVAGEAIEVAAVLAGGGELQGRLEGFVDQRRLEDEILLLWAA